MTLYLKPKCGKGVFECVVCGSFETAARDTIARIGLCARGLPDTDFISDRDGVLALVESALAEGGSDGE